MVIWVSTLNFRISTETYFVKWWVFSYHCTAVSTQINVTLFSHRLIIFLTSNDLKMKHDKLELLHESWNATIMISHESLCIHVCTRISALSAKNRKIESMKYVRIGQSNNMLIREIYNAMEWFQWLIMTESL